MKKGLFVVFEGIDGSGKGTQLELLHHHIKQLDKYNEVLTAREPTRNAEQIRKRLEQDDTITSGVIDMARLFIEDRRQHLQNTILPVLNSGGIVLCDRYMMSTLAYQSAQGIPLDTLLHMHQEAGIIAPDLTLLINTRPEVALERIKKRGQKIEKFEKDFEFAGILWGQYQTIYGRTYKENLTSETLGFISTIDGDKPTKKVFAQVREVFDDVYEVWKSNKQT